MRVELTQELIERGLVCEPGKHRVELVCASGSGLYLEVKENRPGRATAYLRYKDKNGKTCHARIGSVPDVLTLTQVRNAARKLKAEVTLGANPSAEKKARRAVITYHTFFQDHYLPHAKIHKRSWRRDEELYRLRIERVFGGKRLNEITRHRLQTFHTELVAEGLRPATANHHLKLIRQSLNLAREWSMLEGENPASGIAMLEEDNKIERYLSDEELQRLLEVLRTDHNRPVCNVALFLLSTGCRLNEALSATWPDVNIDTRVFTVRSSNSKSKRTRSVPLNDSAIEVLNGLATREAGGPIFVSDRTGEALTTIAKQWDRIRKRAGLPELRLHDLRHSYASFLVNDGRTLYEVQAILGHSSSRVTERYSHLSTKTLQQAASSASAKILGSGTKAAM